MKRRIKKLKKIKKPLFFNGVHKTKIRVIGIGGGGNSIVSEIAKNPVFSKKGGIDFWVANTDFQALRKAGKKVKIFQFGQNETNGLGCGMDFRLGEKVAQNKEEKIEKILKGTDLCILVSCLGGGTGSGAAPVFAKVSQNFKNINFGFFTLPFKFEGKKRTKIARDSLLKLKPNLNSFIVFPNEKIFKIIDKETSLKQAFSALNSILAENLKSLIEVIYQPGLINIDWADLKTILAGRQKLAYLATGQAQGENRVKEALKQVLESPFCQYSMDGFLVERILFNIAGSKDLAMAEVGEISETISNFNKKAKIVFGISQSPHLKNKIKITLLVIGRERKIERLKKPRLKIKKRKKVTLGETTSSQDAKRLSGKKPIKKKLEKPEEKSSPAKTSDSKEEKKPKKAKKAKRQKESKKKVKTISVKPIQVSRDKILKHKRAGQNKIKSKIRKNAIQIKKEMEKAEKEILKQEKIWEFPAFLRKKNNK